ncbi:flagellar hook-associated protein FlgK [Shewanella sp. OPT22]|nr:flagellar hook-associated protein FlgK [Shewanella sp. OPT22]
MSNDLLNIGRNGLLTSQSQLAVTSNNIANANTAGYHRQVATQSTLGARQVGGEYYGSGSYVSDVKRIYNEFASRELRIGQSTLSEAETSFSKLSQLDQLFSEIGKSVPNSLNDVFAQMNGLVDLPDDIGSRTTVLSSATQMAQSINQMQNHLDAQIKNTNGEIAGSVEQLNELSSELAKINLELRENGGENSQLLDRQESIIQEMSKFGNISVIPLDGGAKSIMLGGNTMLVTGESATPLEVKTGDPFPNNTQIVAKVGDKEVPLNGSNVGGSLGALFEYRDDSLFNAQQELSQFALGVADAFNKTQAEGVDLNGNLGKPIFADINDPSMSFGRVGANPNNAGTANLSVNIDDVSSLSGNEYKLTYDGTDYKLVDSETGSEQTLTLTGNTLSGADGFSVDIDDPTNLASGDSFTIRPNGSAASGIAVTMTDPKEIAAGSPDSFVTAADGNSGNTNVKITGLDRNATGFESPITVNLDTTASPATYSILDEGGNSLAIGNVAGTPSTISALGVDIEIDSTTSETSSFTLDFTPKPGDNSNAVKLAGLSEQKLMNDGKSTLIDVYQDAKQDIGSQTKGSEIRLVSADAVYQQAYSRVQSDSGVNLDEEASNLLRFQQSYQASARVMTTAQQVFDTLFNAI